MQEFGFQQAQKVAKEDKRLQGPFAIIFIKGIKSEKREWGGKERKHFYVFAEKYDGEWHIEDPHSSLFW